MTPSLRAELKSKAHHLKPIIIVGAEGLTSGVHHEIDRALNDHELIKIRVNAEDRSERKTLTQDILQHHKADLIGSIGHIIIVYRKNNE